VGPTS